MGKFISEALGYKGYRLRCKETFADRWPYSVHTSMASISQQNAANLWQATDANPQAAPRLGEREREVLEVLWIEGSATVQQVADCLQTALAYTTVMTTLDRLYKKGLLRRNKRDRAFVYRPALSKSDLERGRASEMLHRLFSDSNMNEDVLLSCLVDAVQNYDTDLLGRLEKKVHVAKERAAEARKKGALQ
jgi:predicted transcriptional regulator